MTSTFKHGSGTRQWYPWVARGEMDSDEFDKSEESWKLTRCPNACTPDGRLTQVQSLKGESRGPPLRIGYGSYYSTEDNNRAV
jgi:hypothetical protein